MSEASFKAVEAAPVTGRVLKRTYRIVEPLGDGAMGSVFVAEHLRLKRRVAVKIMGTKLPNQEQAVARFEQEAEVIARLSNPHVVNVIDFDTTDDGELYLVMELLHGETLGKLLERRGRLTPTEAVTIAMQIAAGLAAAHRCHVVHRDLKPANVFLVKMEDESLFAKLLDFGISKALDAGRKSITGEHDIVGTPDYMSPEQAGGEGAVGDRADQFSLAAIVFEMLTGRVPFQGVDAMRVCLSILKDRAPLLTDVAPDVPRALDPILQRAFAKKAELRYPSVLEFARALTAALSEGVPVSQQGQGLLPSVSSQWARVMGVSMSPIPAQPYRKSETEITAVRRSRSQAARPAVDAPPSTDAEGEVREALERARQAQADGDAELALSHIELARRVAKEADSDAARQALGAASELVESVLIARLGSLGSRLRPVERADSSAMSPEEAFVLSRIEAGMTVEELPDLCPFPRSDLFGLLIGLVRRGTVVVERV